MKYAFIKENRQVFSIGGMCAVLGISRSGYYEWLGRPESARCQEERRLGEKILEIHTVSRETYGARRIQKMLADQGEALSRARTRRLMKQQGLESKSRHKFKATTNSNHNRPVAPNLLAREFEVDKPNTVYVGDITYIATAEGWLYLAVWIDLYSRAIVGWAMSERINAQLVTDALIMSIWRRRPGRGLMVHSDQGSQYASELYQETLKAHGFICSMSRRGNCWDNAPAESFFHTLKTELVYHRRYQSRDEAKQDIFEYIEVFYNRQRCHSTIGYQTPMGYEEQNRNVA